ncbi:MAG: hypothetical protein RXP86_11885 [Acidilobus sp.]
MNEDQQADKEEYVEYRLRIPKSVHAKLHYLKIYYQYIGKYKVRSLNDVILIAINEFLERHEEDLTSSA